LAPAARFLERRALHGADVLVGVSAPIARYLGELHGKTTVCIPSGFDWEGHPESVPLTEDFTLTYTGHIYPGRRDPSELFKALVLLRHESPQLLERFQCRFVGGNSRGILAPLVHALDLDDVVSFLPQVSRDESRKLQSESTALLLLNWNDPRDEGTYSGKLFEYLGARRPILAVSTYVHGSAAKLIRQSGCGVVANAAEDIKGVLSKWMQEWQTHSSILTNFRPDETVLARYTWRNQARELAAVFDQVVDSRSDTGRR